MPLLTVLRALETCASPSEFAVKEAVADARPVDALALLVAIFAFEATSKLCADEMADEVTPIFTLRVLVLGVIVFDTAEDTVTNPALLRASTIGRFGSGVTAVDNELRRVLSGRPRLVT